MLDGAECGEEDRVIAHAVIGNGELMCLHWIIVNNLDAWASASGYSRPGVLNVRGWWVGVEGLRASCSSGKGCA